MKVQTFENDWLCDHSPSPLSFEKSWMEDINRECIVVFIGISLLLSLIVNWRLKVESVFSRFHHFCGWVKWYENDRVDAILSLRFQWNENANFWKCIHVDGALELYKLLYNSNSVYSISALALIHCIIQIAVHILKHVYMSLTFSL